MFHEPVLLQKSLELLISNPNGLFLDGTLGGGGHAEAILKRLEPKGKLIGLDLDAEALDHAKERLHKYKNKLIIKQANFREFNQILDGLNIKQLDGILLDLGLSSHQIDTAERGFSFSGTGELDMRMNQKQKLAAYEIINSYSEDELGGLFRKYGEERRSRAVARNIVRERMKAPIKSTKELTEVMSKVLTYQNRVKSLARLYQALRVAVNNELDNLAAALKLCLDYLGPFSRIVVISYHSLEDRIVKDFFRQECERCVCPPELPVCVCGQKGRLKILTKRPVRPDVVEVQRNPRSRSSKLRAAEILPLNNTD